MDSKNQTTSRYTSHNHPSQDQSHQTHAFQMINPNTLYNPAPFAYSHVAEIRQFSRILHISGQGGENLQGQLSKDFSLQVRQAFVNLQHALEAASASLTDIAVLRVLIVDHSTKKHQILIQEMQHRWNDHAFPACTLIPVPCLALQGMMIEIEATAYLI